MKIQILVSCIKLIRNTESRAYIRGYNPNAKINNKDSISCNNQKSVCVCKPLMSAEEKGEIWD